MDKLSGLVDFFLDRNQFPNITIVHLCDFNSSILSEWGRSGVIFVDILAICVSAEVVLLDNDENLIDDTYITNALVKKEV